MRQELGRDAAWGALAAFVACAVVGVSEVAFGGPAALREGTTTGAAFAALALSLAIAAAIPLAAIAITALLIVRSAIRLFAGAEAAARWRGPFAPGERGGSDGRAASWIHGVGAGLVVFAVGAATTIGWLVVTFREPLLIGLVAAAFALVWLAVAAVIAAVVARACRRALAHRASASMRGPRAAFAVWIGVTWLVVLILTTRSSPVVQVFPFVVDGAFSLRLLVAASLAGAATLAVSARVDRIAPWLRGSRRAVAAAVAVAAVTLAALGNRADQARRLALESPTLAVLTRVVQRATDLDRDGSSSLLGGGDCAPFDGAIHPGARELAADGIDQNCNGADLRPGPRPSPAADAPLPAALRRDDLSVLLVTIDALRFDHVGFAGYRRATTPTIDRLAARGTWFERAYSTSYRTWFVMPALVASRFAQEIGLPIEPFGAGRPVPLPEAVVTMAERLRDAGLRTGMFTSFYYFDTWQLEQGVDEFVNLPTAGERDRTGAQLVTDRAIAFVRAQPSGRRWFAWLHYFEPHLPYAQHEVRFGDRDVDRYDSEIRHVDDQLARLADAVDLDRTIVVVTSDHGEGLGEHSVHGHTAGLHDSLIHVPLIVLVPGVAARRAAVPASTIDLAPTIAAFAGVAPDPSWTGRAHVAAIAHGRDDAAHIVFSSDPTRGRYAAITSGYRLTRDHRTGLDSFVNLGGDPAREASERARLQAALTAWHDRTVEAAANRAANPETF